MSQFDRAILEQTLEALAFDHRASIVAYFQSQATAFELNGQRDVAVVLRAQASNVAIRADLLEGRAGIASPVHAIIYQICGVMGGTNINEVLGAGKVSDQACRVRTAAMWVCRRRLAWSNEELGRDFKRDPSTISAGVARAEQYRSSDDEFRRVTDDASKETVRCANCQHPLLHCA